MKSLSLIIVLSALSYVACGPFESEMLKLHNAKRAKHKAPKLKISKELTAAATKWATKLAQANAGLKHSGAPGMGENLAFLANAKGDKKVLARKMFKLWYDDEKPLFNFATGGFAASTGHFTQVVWKATTKLGCGVTCKNKKCYGVCTYKPQGNVSGKFRQNVIKD